MLEGLKTQKKVFEKAIKITTILIKKGIPRDKAIKYSYLWQLRALGNLNNEKENEQFQSLKEKLSFFL